tara:strand:+ start:178 stop:411 length:234 start_codon:yes stop_codon:yes gene_type:complete
MTDQQIRNRAVADFVTEGTAKFNAGIQEHNPNGDKGLDRMSKAQKLKAVKEEILDLWFYVTALAIEVERDENREDNA